MLFDTCCSLRSSVATSASSLKTIIASSSPSAAKSQQVAAGRQPCEKVGNIHDQAVPWGHLESCKRQDVGYQRHSWLL